LSAMAGYVAGQADAKPAEVSTACDGPDHPLWDPAWTPGLGEETIKKRSAVAQAEVTFYAAHWSGRTHRVWIALEELGVDYKWVEANPYAVDPAKKGGYSKKALSFEQKKELDPAWIVASPWGYVPALCCADSKGKQRNVWESLTMVDFLDDVYGSGNPATEARLMPVCPFDRAKVRIYLPLFDAKVNGPFAKMFIAGGDQEECTAAIIQGCREVVQGMAPIEEGPFFLGKEFSQFEVNTAGFWWRWTDIVRFKFGKSILPGDEDPDFKRLGQWWDAVSSWPSVARTMCSSQRIYDSNADYMSGQSTSNFAKLVKAGK